MIYTLKNQNPPGSFSFASFRRIPFTLKHIFALMCCYITILSKNRSALFGNCFRILITALIFPDNDGINRSGKAKFLNIAFTVIIVLTRRIRHSEDIIVPKKWKAALSIGKFIAGWSCSGRDGKSHPNGKTGTRSVKETMPGQMQRKVLEYALQPARKYQP